MEKLKILFDEMLIAEVRRHNGVPKLSFEEAKFREAMAAFLEEPDGWEVVSAAAKKLSAAGFPESVDDGGSGGQPITLEEQIDAAIEALEKLKAFKTWVHGYLDKNGVATHPPGTHGAEGCRIGDRLDWLLSAMKGRDFFITLPDSEPKRGKSHQEGSHEFYDVRVHAVGQIALPRGRKQIHTREVL